VGGASHPNLGTGSGLWYLSAGDQYVQDVGATVMAGMPDLIDVSMTDAATDILISIKVKKQARFWFRMWLMTQLLTAAKWVSPVAVEILDENK
jgi:hypothetical protein